MLTPFEAQDLILKRTTTLPVEYVSLDQAEGRTLSDDLYATCDLPLFNNSAMDGYAVRWEDVVGASKGSPKELDVRDELRAGATVGDGLKKGQAIKIMTGAPVPPGADSIAIKEATQDKGDGSIQVLSEFKKGDHIRPKGEDVKAGERLLSRGTKLRPYEVALLAAQGLTSIPVIRKPQVAVLATGDELVSPDQEPSAGKIRNTNGPALVAAMSRWRVPAHDEGICEDDPALLEKKIRTALEAQDVLLITGGVSVGDYDFTQDVLKKVGVKIVFWKTAIKPGKPLLFGILPNNKEGAPFQNKLVFGLPGNPISALVCLEEFVRPALEKMQGYAPKYPSYHLKGVAENEYPKTPQRQQYLFCQVRKKEDQFVVHIIRPQGSAMVGMAVQANALALGPIGVGKISKGDELAFRWLK